MAQGKDKSRLTLTLAVILWVSAAVALFVGIQLRVKPILFVGLLDGLLALVVTMLALRGGSKSA